MATIKDLPINREFKINFILMHRHGTGSKLVRLWSGLGRRRVQPPAEPSPEVHAAEAALEALTDDELEVQYRGAYEESARNAAEQAAKDEAIRPFNVLWVDFSHWAKCAYWTIEEAVALVLGRDPRRANPEAIKPYLQVSSFAHLFSMTLDLANRGVGAQQLTKPTAPGAFLVWAKRYDIAIPHHLETEVAKYGHFIGDWKTLFDQAKVQRDEAFAREKAIGAILAQAKQQVEELSRQVAATATMVAAIPKRTKPGDPRELDTLRKLCIGMAIRGYSFNPKDGRSTVIAEIVGDLEQLGIPVNRDTVRKHLKAGADILPQGWEQAARK